MKVRIFNNKDGSVSVIHPVREAREDETKQERLDSIFNKATPGGAEYIDVLASEIPSDRTFRNAWTKNGVGVEVNMPRAKKIHMDRIRIERNKKIAELDVPFMQAVEQKDTVKQDEIAIEKQILRDIPQVFDLAIATTPDELKVLWPEELT